MHFEVFKRLTSLFDEYVNLALLTLVSIGAYLVRCTVGIIIDVFVKT